LAYAKTHGATAIIDDGPARRVAQINKVKYRGTLGLLCDAIRESLLSIDLASAVADHLLESEYRLPFKRGEFKKWVHDQGLLPPTA
jgi:predicted nucleic acid-binding protein